MLMMLPFEAPTIFEGIHKSYFRMPRVVKDQKSRFENDDLFRQLSHESAVKYTGFKDRPLEERQMKFIANCQEGHTEISVVQSGSQFTLMFNPAGDPDYNNEGCSFNKEPGKVSIAASFILNGVCVIWRGCIDLQRLEGFGRLHFDSNRAYLEDTMVKQQLDKQQQQQQQQQQQHSLQCNNSTPPGLQTSPLGRLNHHHHQHHALAGTGHLGPGGPNNLTGHVGAFPAGCLGGPGGPLDGPVGQPPAPTEPAHYGSAAIAAATAAAFHQALSVGSLPGHAGPGSLHGLGGPPLSQAAAAVAAAAAAAAAAHGGHHSLASGLHQVAGGPGAAYVANGQGPPGSQLLASNGGPNGGLHPGAQLAQLAQLARPTGHQNSPPLSNGATPTRQHSGSRSPDRDLSLQKPARQTLKRRASQIISAGDESQTQLDEVDVVSDIHSHDLDFPPRRLFKAEPIAVSHHHHHHHHHQHRSARRA